MKKNNITNQKSFYFQDYNHQFIDEIKNSKFAINQDRIYLLFFIFFCLIFIFAAKIFFISLKDLDSKNYVKNYNFFKPLRNDILDRNGDPIARNILVYHAAIKPNLINDKKKFILKLKLLYPDLNFKVIKNSLKKNKYFYLKRNITQEERNKLWSLGEKGLLFERTQTRIYPQKNLFSHVIGQIDSDNNGISGAEKYFDKNLKKVDNEPLYLSLDTNLQYLIREELLQSISDFKAKGAASVLMDVGTGEILSLISLPDYNLNIRQDIKDRNFTNKITKGVFELGSIFKTFTIALAMENNLFSPNTVIKNIPDEIKCSKYTISEHDKLPQNLNTEQILIRSSNIGAVRIAQKLGIEKYKNFLNSLELLNTINFDLEEVGTPILFKWGKCKLATTSYGHGITTTPLQLAKAYAILGNGGYKIQPSILKKNIKSLEKREQIISEKTSNEINLMLRKVVSLDEGTANFADIEGYEVAGKTGTALKYNSKLKLNTFVSLFPASRPKYVLLVMLDEPKPAPNYVYEFPPSEKFPNGYKYKGETRNTSGWNTVVIAGKIIEKIGPILAINNLEASNNF